MRKQTWMSFVASLGLLASLSLSAGQDQPKVDPGINKQFADPDVSKFVGRFESESREVYSARDSIVGSMKLRPGIKVADVGAGTGLFTIPVAKAVGEKGKVVAVDISAKFLKHIEERATKEGLAQVETRLGQQDGPGLKAGEFDVVFICDTYHHFEDPATMMKAIASALKPGGELFLVEFDRREGVSEPFVLEHVRASKDVFVSEIEQSGLKRVPFQQPGELKQNFMARFVKPGLVGRTGRPESLQSKAP